MTMMPPGKVPPQAAKCLPLYPSYVDYCTKKHADPIDEAAQVFERHALHLHVDNLDPDELRIMFDFLSKCTTINHAYIDVGKVPTKRALRQKLIRIGLDQPYAMLQPGYTRIIRSVSLMALKATSLQSLHLVGIQITSDLVLDLAKGLGSCHSLVSIDVDGSNLGDTGLDVLEEVFANRPHLCHLGMAKCNLTDASARPIARILRAQAARRDETYWSTTLRGETVPVRGEGCFLLNLAKNALGDAATDILCHALYNDCWLYGLNLSENKVGPRGVLNFAEILQTNTTLTVLLLHDNTNTDNRVSGFINKLLADRHSADSQPMNHPMEHVLLKDALRSWGCLRPSVNDMIADMFTTTPSKVLASASTTQRPTKATKTSQAAVAKIPPSGPTTRSNYLKKKATTTSSSLPRRHSAPLQTKRTPPAKEKNAAKTSSRTKKESGIRRPLTAPPAKTAPVDEMDGPSALDMLVTDQIFRSNQEPTTHGGPAKRLDQQMLMKLMERISTLETAQAKAQEHIDRVEAENLALKQRVAATLDVPAEADIMHDLESAIVKLTHQVQELEHIKRQPRAKLQPMPYLDDGVVDDLSFQLKQSFGL
ncbi:Aste57867_25203 [Aphanomyces stellatus]|uniref:Aste57867_25203 protein n=1 Tax=Aphanomyces stellatus TaxID=120398 RepID=A0A485LT72_9STRA|nr:hypothetical protein As57867_025125 [Aphanomyces stellatus]VFU01830.1 Aste57867_25203 [Aphanomyces stellatus]